MGLIVGDFGFLPAIFNKQETRAESYASSEMHARWMYLRQANVQRDKKKRWNTPCWHGQNFYGFDGGENHELSCSKLPLGYI